MGYSKVIDLGQIGKFSVSESDGVATVGMSFGGSLGGGQAKGIISAKSSNEVDMEFLHLVDLGFGLAEAKFPAVAALLKEAQVIMDAELAKA